MEVITIETPALGDRSYLAHDGVTAIVIDPQRDIERIISAADLANVCIDAIFETHLHNDYLSGGLVLSRLTNAPLHHAAAEDLSFEHTEVRGGDKLTFGSLNIEVVATPGHTQHHLTYVVRAEDNADPAVFTGGSLLYGTVGRTDLLGPGCAEALTRAQYRSVRRIADDLPDGAAIHPTHGFGSFCSSASADAESDGSLGTERTVNLALTIDDENTFVTRLLDGLSSYPSYYAHMSHLNRGGPGPVDLTRPHPLDPAELAQRIHRGEWIVDLRPRRLFAEEHLRGTIGVELTEDFSTYVGWVLPWGTPVSLLGETPEQITDAQRQLSRIGIDRPSGGATGGPRSWPDDITLQGYPFLTFHEVIGHEGIVLDVRRHDERSKQHICDSLHVPLDEILDRAHELPDDLLLVHCASGYRASIAASLLDRAGKRVALIDDDFANAVEVLDVIDAGT